MGRTERDLINISYFYIDAYKGVQIPLIPQKSSMHHRLKRTEFLWPTPLQRCTKKLFENLNWVMWNTERL